MSKKISIIIPCYNVELYIERCINSLLKQSIGLEHLELIFVNDASTDSTLEVLIEYEKHYSDIIKIINLPHNIRQGGARNIGIEYASADYIGFVDADDWVEPLMYEKLYNAATQYDCDLVSCDIWIDKNNDDIKRVKERKDAFYIIGNEDDRRALILDGIKGGICTKIYRKSILESHNISFPIGLAYEDNYFMALCLLYIKRIYVIDEYLYHYCIRMNSTVTSVDSIHQFDKLKIELIKLDEYKKREKYQLYQNEIEYNFLVLFYLNSLHSLFLKFTHVQYDMFLYMQQCVKRLFPNFIENIYLSDGEKKWMTTVNQTLTLQEFTELSEKYKDTYRV